MIYCINKDKVEKTAGAKTAGKKAPDDIAELTCRLGGKCISFTADDSTISFSPLRKARNIYYSYRDWKDLYKTVHRRDAIIIQHPYEGIQAGLKYIPLIQKKGASVICLIHDLRALRDSIDEKRGKFTRNKSDSGEIKLLAMSDHIIAHNDSMKQYLINGLGLDANKIHILGIFDYLCSNADRAIKFDRSIAIAGNLSKNKCKYLYSMLNINDIELPIHLYGPNYEGNSKRVNYHGVVAPDELPGILEGSFGLVWDGDEIEGCGGVAGEYLKYNNPHKCSLYLAAGLPVIIWKKAALASFVEDNGVGFVINGLTELNAVVGRMGDNQYYEYKHNAEQVQKLIASGYYFKNVITKVLGMTHLTF